MSILQNLGQMLKTTLGGESPRNLGRTDLDLPSSGSRPGTYGSTGPSGNLGNTVGGGLGPLSGLGNLFNSSGLSNMFTSGKVKDLLGPAALGGLAGALLSSRGARGITGGALLASGGAYLWNQYKARMQAANGDMAQPMVQSSPEDAAQRMIRALVFAARSDGHIDDAELNNIQTKIRELNLGPAAQDMVKAALEEPFDPDLVARGVQGPDEALQLYTLSAAIIMSENPQERAYLDSLAQALKIPSDVKNDIEAKLTTPASMA